LSTGYFVWHDLMSTDAEKALSFYQGLLGWSTDVQDMGTGPYTMVKVGDKHVGGIVPLDASHGLPSHWISYISVDDLDASCKRIGELGGKVLQEPFTVPGVGRMVVAADPGGAYFSPFEDENPDYQPELPQGVQPGGAVAWHELTASNPEGAIAFYTALLGWGRADWDMGDYTYHGMTIGEVPVAGIFQRPADVPVDAWTIYFEAPGDMDSTLARVRELGGTVLREKFHVEGTGDIGVAADPTGAVFGLLKSDPMD
jgi:predicted enzyme related to lactoylglutathione lyase